MADDSGVGAEAAAPERVGKQHHTVLRANLLRRCEVPAEQRADAVDAQEIAGDALTIQAFGLAAALECGLPGPANSNAGKGRGHPLHVEKGRIAGIVLFAVPIALPDRDDPVRLRIGKRAEENGIDDRVDGGRRSHAESKSHDGEAGEAGPATQLAKSVAKVRTEAGHGLSSGSGGEKAWAANPERGGGAEQRAEITHGAGTVELLEVAENELAFGPRQQPSEPAREVHGASQVGARPWLSLRSVV